MSRSVHVTMESNHATTEDRGHEKVVEEETTKAETSASAAAGGTETTAASTTATAATTGDQNDESSPKPSGNEEDEGKVSDADFAASIRGDLERARQGLPVDNNKRTTGDNGDGNAKRNKREYLAFHGTKHTRVGNDYQVDLSKLPVPEPAAAPAAPAAAAPEADPSPAETPGQPSSAVTSQEGNGEQKKTEGSEE